MPATIRGKAEPAPSKKDSAPTGKDAASTGKDAPKGKQSGPERRTGGTAEGSKSTDSPKVTGSSRGRAKDRRKGRAAEVSPEPDSPSPEAAVVSGRIKNLAGFWSTTKEDSQVVRKKRLEVADRSSKAVEESDSASSDEELDEIRRAQEAPVEQPVIEIEKGRAKSIASMWGNRKDDETATKKTPFKLDIKTEEPTVFENEPVVLEGVVRSDDRSAREEIVVRRPGRIKDLAVNFASVAAQPKTDDSEEEGEADKQSTVKKTEEAIERGKIRNVRQRWMKRQQKSTGGDDSDSADSDSSDHSTEKVVTPQRPLRKTRDHVIEQAKVKNVRDRWVKRQDGADEKEEEDTARAKQKAPVPLHALVTAKEYGVFENEPVVRDDVVRADDDQPDIISCERTQKLRRMWTMMEKEVTKDKEPSKGPEIIVKTKKKEEKQEPEPVEAKESPFSKPRRAGHGRLGQGQKDNPKQKAEESKPATKDQRADKKTSKLQKAYTVATATETTDKLPTPKSPSLMRYSSRKKIA